MARERKTPTSRGPSPRVGEAQLFRARRESREHSLHSHHPCDVVAGVVIAAATVGRELEAIARVTVAFLGTAQVHQRGKTLLLRWRRAVNPIPRKRRRDGAIEKCGRELDRMARY